MGGFKIQLYGESYNTVVIEDTISFLIHTVEACKIFESVYGTHQNQWNQHCKFVSLSVSV